MLFKRVLFTSLIFLSSYQIYSEGFSLTRGEKDWLKDHPVIRLGVGTSFPPVQYVNEEDGEYEFLGIASDYVAILRDLLGVEFKIEYGITFKEAMEMGKRQELDMFPCLAYTKERDEFLDFTEGYLKNPMVIWANTDAPFIGSIQDLSGLRVADVEALYVYGLLKRDVPGINFVLEENAEASLESVAFGRADANVAGLISGSYMVQNNNWTNIKVAAPTPYPDTVFRMAVREDWPELTEILDRALSSIGQDQHNDIKRKWIAVRYEYGIDRATVLKRLLLIAGIAIVVIGISFLWVVRLIREIRRRKEVEQSLSEREQQLRKMVDDKELLIREVHHRVKNNLNLVSGLIKLQASELSNPKDIEKMKLVNLRIDSIILLHQKLSMSADMKNIDFRDYLDELLGSIRETRSIKTAEVEIKAETVSAAFDAEIIIPLGLIITELVTNALKYGFSESANGLIEIRMKKKQDKRYILTVRNNGTPISDELDLDNLKSLGLMLVLSLVEQLDGEIELTKAPGPSFRITFSSK